MGDSSLPAICDGSHAELSQQELDAQVSRIFSDCSYDQFENLLVSTYRAYSREHTVKECELFIRNCANFAHTRSAFKDDPGSLSRLEHAITRCVSFNMHDDMRNMLDIIETKSRKRVTSAVLEWIMSRSGLEHQGKLTASAIFDDLFQHAFEAPSDRQLQVRADAVGAVLPCLLADSIFSRCRLMQW